MNREEHLKNKHQVKYFSFSHSPFSRGILRRGEALTIYTLATSLSWLLLGSSFWSTWGKWHGQNLSHPACYPNAMRIPHKDPLLFSGYYCRHHTTSLIRTPHCLWGWPGGVSSLSQFKNVDNIPKHKNVRSWAQLEQALSAAKFPIQYKWIRNMYPKPKKKNCWNLINNKVMARAPHSIKSNSDGSRICELILCK